jgi:hypothetical protein
MALWRDIGAVETIGAGRTQLWRITYGNGRDVGVVVGAPNLHQFVADVELIALEQGVFARASSEELGTQTHYTVRIRNAGTSGIRYNLNVADWQPDGGEAPAAVRIRQLRPEVSDPPATVLAAARRAKKKRSGGGARKRKAARRP